MSVFLTELQPDHLPVLAHSVGPGHGAEAYIDSNLKNYIRPVVSQLEKCNLGRGKALLEKKNIPRFAPTSLDRKTSDCASKVLIRYLGTSVLLHPHSWYFRSHSGRGVDLEMESGFS